MKPIDPKTSLIPAKPVSLIVRIFLISMGLLMSHEVLAGAEKPTDHGLPIPIPFMNFFPEATPIEGPLTYKYGDVGPGGGIVFYLEDADQHGLEAQANDYNDGEELTWYDAITGAASYTNSAGLDCSNYLLNPMCWHLPTKTELELLYEQQNVVGGFAVGYYWSSAEGGNSNAWNQGFNLGNQNNGNKDASLRVRAVRAF